MGSKWSKDDALIWLSGGALVVGLLMAAGLILVIVVHGLGGFWPQELTRYVMRDGRIILGHETSRVGVGTTDSAGKRSMAYRLRVRTGDLTLYPVEHIWLEEGGVAGRDAPREAVVVEQVRGGDAFGFLDSFVDDGIVVAGVMMPFGPITGNSPRNWNACGGGKRCPSSCLRWMAGSTPFPWRTSSESTHPMR